MTGQYTIPYVFFNKKFIGGYNETIKLLNG